MLHLNSALRFTLNLKISPRPVAEGVVHVQDLLDRHQVGGDDGIEVGTGRLLVAAGRDKA